MNDEMKKDLIIGMLVGLAGCFKIHMNCDQTETYESILQMINEIYYPPKDLNKPTTRNFNE